MLTELFLQGYYRHTSREIRRLGSVARSPVYAGFSEALDGAATIRGFRAQAAFAAQNVERLNTLQRANFAGASACERIPATPAGPSTRMSSGRCLARAPAKIGSCSGCGQKVGPQKWASTKDILASPAIVVK
jgi:hypothetical protein